MTTKHVVADDSFGKIARRTWELQRRVLEGSIDPEDASQILQRAMEPVRPVYFRDDHNRTIRVLTWPEGKTELHILVDYGKQYVWVPYEEAVPKSNSSIESPFGINVLRARAVNCALYENP